MGGPRRINLVSISIGLMVAAVIYLGWKVIPVYWQAQKVDNLLSGHKQEAAEIILVRNDPREARILDQVRREVAELGIDDPRLLVSFGPGYRSLHVAYDVEVRFLTGHSKTFHFDRSVEIPRDDF